MRLINDGHVRVESLQCGLYRSTKYIFLAGPPDALIRCESHGIFTAEVKFPLKCKDRTPQMQTESDASFCMQNIGGKYVLKRTHPYFYQVQLHMFLVGIPCSYFVIWSLVGVIIQQVYFDEIFMEHMIKKADKCFQALYSPRDTS